MGIYTRNLVRELLSTASDGPMDVVDWVLLWRAEADRKDAASSLGERLDGVEQHVLSGLPIPGLGKLAWDQWQIPRAARQLRLDALLHPKFTAPLAAPCPVAMTVHGADWWDPAEARFYGRLDTIYIRLVMPWYFRRCGLVISVSEQSSRGFTKALGSKAAAKLRTVPFGPATHFAPVDDHATRVRVAARYQLPNRYVLTLGKPSALQRKNLDGVVRAYRRYAARAGEAAVPLVIGGPEPARLRRALGVSTEESSIVFPGWLDQADLPAIYTGAIVFFYPSHLEAFPIPLAESLACGTPIVTSDREGPREVAGDAARYVDPDDPQAASAVLAELVADDCARADLAARGLDRATRFSWPRAAARIRALMVELARGEA